MERMLKLPVTKAAIVVSIVAVLVTMSFYNFLLFHTLVELFSVLVAFGIAAIAFHTSQLTEERNDFLNFFGVAYLCIGFLDLLHTLAYDGMGVFPGNTANLATQLWIIPRYIEAFTFLAVPFLMANPGRRIRIHYLIPVISLVLLASVFAGIFPDSFIPGEGLTRFKIISEYIISTILLISGILIWRNKEKFDKEVLKYLLLACGATIFAELSFTFYVSVYGFSNMVGHLFNVASYYFIYVIMIRKKLLEPYEVINDLYQNLDKKVKVRTRELEVANMRLAEGQRRLSQLNQKLGESNRLKSEFTATMTHELRTPLTSVVAFCELMLDEVSGPITPEQRENLLDIKTSAQQLMILVNDILDMAKHEAGTLRVHKENVDLNDVLRSVRRSMSAVAHQNGISLDVEKATLPLVYGDRDRIQQMVVNLVANAIKFTKDSGRITVSAKAEGDFAVISVQDTGIGIPPELLPHIFEKFRQGDYPKQRSKGTGLGLALVKTLAELQDGRVAVDSEVGEGSCFKIYLPFASEQNESGSISRAL
ncbi:sensor histidine kinase [Dethiobacter alkaliphilus]|uniref:sensor histidine kinase n=1 Tax=Dethiobacter alkaliphilus TaxID=427926 RepID=UPI002226F702|nr:MASE3 domain-containing protein [Dethiobacter alkaliphilus]MCW3488811.1 ATP-binding protein [Dethiobacter alkaliphilus]